MRGQARRSYVGENMLAYTATRDLNKYRLTRTKLCWKCQKDKPQLGGSAQTLDGFGGSLHKFVCKDCLDAKERNLKREE